MRAHLRREKPDRARTVVLELGPGAGYADRATSSCARRPRRPAWTASGGASRLRRLPVLWLGASDEHALDSALACVDALDAELP